MGGRRGKEVSLFGGDLEKKLEALKSDEAKASEMEHAIRHEIHVKLEEDPAFYRTLRERLLQIIEDRKARRIDEAEQLSLLQKLVDDVRGHGQAAEAEGMSETGFAIYGLLKGAGVGTGTDARTPKGAGTAGAGAVSDTAPVFGEDRLREVVTGIEHAVEPFVDLVDWSAKVDIQREMRKQIKRRLPNEVYSKAEQERLAVALIDLLRVRKGK